MKRLIKFSGGGAVTIPNDANLSISISGQEIVSEVFVGEEQSKEEIKQVFNKLKAEDQTRADMVRWQNEAKAKELEDIVNTLVDKKVKEIEFEKNKKSLENPPNK